MLNRRRDPGEPPDVDAVVAAWLTDLDRRRTALECAQPIASERLVRVATGDAPVEDAAAVRAHVATCLPCLNAYAELLGEIVSEARRTQSERRALEQELNDLRSQSLMREIASAPRATSRRAFDSGIDDDVMPSVSSRDEIVARFLRSYEATKREASADLDELFEAIDAKVADLADLDERSLPEAALELAALLVRAAKSAQETRE